MLERVIIKGHSFIPYRPAVYPEAEMIRRSQEFRIEMQGRRSLRDFSDREVPLELVLNAIATASLAPSGANKQPWTFCLIGDPVLKKQIRILAEEEERISYEGRMSERWLKDLEPLGTDHNKPFLEKAPYLIVVFKRINEESEEGTKLNNYYVNESVGIAVGFLLAALHHAGLCTLTHTPSPMSFLQECLQRPQNERPYLLIPVGFADESALVPDISKKTEKEYLISYF